MIPAIGPEVDYKALVRQGYDACAAAYNESRKTASGIEIRELSDCLDDGGAALDVGCGAGVPVAKSLAARYRVTGVDVSQEMGHLARRNVPTGDFICADIMTVPLPPSSWSNRNGRRDLGRLCHNRIDHRDSSPGRNQWSG